MLSHYKHNLPMVFSYLLLGLIKCFHPSPGIPSCSASNLEENAHEKETHFCYTWKERKKIIIAVPCRGSLNSKLISSEIQTQMQINLHASAIVESRNYIEPFKPKIQGTVYVIKFNSGNLVKHFDDTPHNKCGNKCLQWNEGGVPNKELQLKIFILKEK